MTITEERLQALQQATQQIVTEKSAQESLIKCGILTKKGNIAKPYTEVFTKENK